MPGSFGRWNVSFRKWRSFDGIQKQSLWGEEKGERIIIFGSLYFIGEVKAMFESGRIDLQNH